MDREEFLSSLNKTAISTENVDKIKQIYGCTPSVELKKILSFDNNGIFFDGGSFCRLLSLDEIINATRELHVDFVKHGFVPLFDIEDNNFIVWDFANNCWKKFNIVDETPYGTRKSLTEIL